jgi:hypothetical protein
VFGAVNLAVGLNKDDCIVGGMSVNNEEFPSSNASGNRCANVACYVNDGAYVCDTCKLVDKASNYESVSKCMNNGDLVREFHELKDKYQFFVNLQELDTEAVPERKPNPICERNSQEQSLVQEVEKVVDEELCVAEVCEMSTPIDTYILCEPPDQSEPISVGNEMVTDSGSNDEDSLSRDRFLVWLDQSMSVHEEMLNRVATVSKSFNSNWKKDWADLIDLDDDNDPGESLHDMAKKNALKAAMEHIQYVRESISGYKDGVTEPWRDKHVGKTV